MKEDKRRFCIRFYSTGEQGVKGNWCLRKSMYLYSIHRCKMAMLLLFIKFDRVRARARYTILNAWSYSWLYQ